MPRDRQQSDRRSLVAAARRLDPVNDAKRPQFRPKVEAWQEEAWDYFDSVPEIKQCTRFLGNLLGKLILFVAIADDDGKPIHVNDEKSGVPPAVAAAAIAKLDRLKAAVGGRAQILRQANMNLEIAGEFYIVGRAEHTETKTVDGVQIVTTIAEEWTVHSISEVIVKEEKYYTKTRPNDSGTVVGPLDTIIRCWQQHPRWQDLADSPMRSVLGECASLQMLSQLVYADASSRQSAGLLLVPNEIAFSRQPVDDEDDDVEELDDDDIFLEELGKAMQEPIADPMSASAVQPMLIRGAAEHLAAIRHVQLTRDADASLDQKIEARVQRLARGVNLPVEIVMGHAQTTFSNAEQIDQDVFDDFLQPRCELLVEALTVSFVRPDWIEDTAVGAEWAEKLFIYYDPDALIRHPNTEANADGAHDRSAISNAAYRKAIGFHEDDAPTMEEVMLRHGLRARGMTSAEVVLALLKFSGLPLDVTPIPTAAPDATAPPEKTTPAPTPAPAGMQVDDTMLEVLASYQAGTLSPELMALVEKTLQGDTSGLVASAVTKTAATENPGARLASIDSALRARLTAAASAAMARALERAGNRLRTKANKAGLARQVKGVPTLEIAGKLGPALVASATGDEDLLDGAFDELESQFRTWAGNAQTQALAIAERTAGGFTTAQREVLQLRQATDLDEAWKWMRESMDALARARMFDPSDLGDVIGEFDPSSTVPTGLIRQALARAGGATGIVTNAAISGPSAWVAVYPDGAPTGGIGTGELVLGAVTDAGGYVEAYQWIYGPAYRANPFEEHEVLDGELFADFNADTLSNATSWLPDPGYYPGDHAGCQCDFSPVLVGPGE